MMFRHFFRVIALAVMISLTMSFCFPVHASQITETGTEDSISEEGSADDSSSSEDEDSPSSQTDEEETSSEEEISDPLGLVSESAILMDAETGAILYEKDAYSTGYPASITKIMTAILTVENRSLDDEITFSTTAVTLESGASSIGIQAGEILCVEDCLYGMLLWSANEVANALAEDIGGSIENFGEIMTERAAELGCLNTNFVNPSGLFDESHYTCAYDMALITRQFLQYDELLEVEKALTYTIGYTNLVEETRTFQQKHKMAYSSSEYYYEGGTFLMGKTGYTDASGTTLVTCIEKDGISLIVVLFRAHGTNAYLDTATLLDYGFENYTHAEVSDLDGVYIDSQGILTSIKSQMNLSVDKITYDDDVTVTIPTDFNASLVATETSLLSSPESDGHAGDIQILYDGSSLCTIPFYIDMNTAVSVTAVDNSNAVYTATGLKADTASNFFSVPVFIFLFVIVALIAVVFIAYANVKKKRRERREQRELRRRKYGHFQGSEYHQSES